MKHLSRRWIFLLVPRDYGVWNLDIFRVIAEPSAPKRRMNSVAPWREINGDKMHVLYMNANLVCAQNHDNYSLSKEDYA